MICTRDIEQKSKVNTAIELTICDVALFGCVCEWFLSKYMRLRAYERSSLCVWIDEGLLVELPHCCINCVVIYKHGGERGKNVKTNANVLILSDCFRMPAPQMDGSGPRSELQELQVKSQQVADEVNIN